MIEKVISDNVPSVHLEFHAFDIRVEGLRTDANGDYLDGEVAFDAVVDGTLQRGLVAKVKQAAGSEFADALEVEWPERFVGHLDYEGFRDCVEQYVRQQIAAAILGDHDRSERNIRVEHVRVTADATCVIDAGGA